MVNNSNLSKYQAKYFAFELTRLNKESNLGRLSQALMDAQVDLNPHQVEAASFALTSPLSKGVILADEVGLGKTIEAGLVLCQMWAERKRHLLVICPASLREQWKSELEEKFCLNSIILDRKNYFKSKLDLTDKIIIMSYNMAVKIENDLISISWDLVVMDEAHKLRNVYKTGNKMGRTLSHALQGRKKLLLSATPLQNSLMELYGLSTLIDNNIFGDAKSFKLNYINQDNYASLKTRLGYFCKRTLRSEVLEYIKYTKRKPITFPFNPSQNEQLLYEKVTNFLKKEDSYAIPVKQRHLISLILFKLLASSSDAIYGTFLTMLERLKKIKVGLDTSEVDDCLNDLVEEADLDRDDYLEDCDDEKITDVVDEKKLDTEIDEINAILDLAKSIQEDTKSSELLKALNAGFEEMEKMGANKKALIFTESRRTQEYLNNYLSSHGYKDKIVQFYGGNRLKRNELIANFKDTAEIMIATEAGAEGLNMQFCSLLINYDLPFNPQRVEQRIGRCHRYGQKNDVVVINFVNQKNKVDCRVFELLNEKFKLFDGVFGASDEILGTIEDGVDFEKKILTILQTCRTNEDIEKAFDDLQKEMEDIIDEKMKQTKQKLLDEFDASVHDRLKVNLEQTKIHLTENQQIFWRLAKEILKNDGDFDDNELSFTLKNKQLDIPCKKYYFISPSNKHIELDNSVILRLNHPLSELFINTAKNLDTSDCESITFDVSNAKKRHSYLEKMSKDKIYGWCNCQLLTIDSFEKEEYLVLSGIDNFQKPIDSETLEEMLKLDMKISEYCDPISNVDFLALQSEQDKNIQNTKVISQNRNDSYFREETDKIDRCTDDKLFAVEKEIKDVKSKIKSLEREERSEQNLERRLSLQEEISDLQEKKVKLRHEIFSVEDEIEAERKNLIESLRKNLDASVTTQNLFTIKWKLC